MLNLDDDKKAKIIEYIRNLKTIEDAMEPYKEQKRDLRMDFKRQGWLTQTEQRLATKAYRLMRSEIDLDELYDVYEALVRPASGTATYNNTEEDS
tara:strand:+ start:8038 stop:8322 length:285 start_codon:yes stop_codon:yes gene_type:complete